MDAVCKKVKGQEKGSIIPPKSSLGSFLSDVQKFVLPKNSGSSPERPLDKNLRLSIWPSGFAQGADRKAGAHDRLTG